MPLTYIDEYWKELITNFLDGIIRIESPLRDDVFKKAFKKPEVFDFLNVELGASKSWFGKNRFSSQGSEKDSAEVKEEQEDIEDNAAAPEPETEKVIMEIQMMEDPISYDSDTIEEKQVTISERKQVYGCADDSPLSNRNCANFTETLEEEDAPRTETTYTTNQANKGQTIDQSQDESNKDQSSEKVDQ